VIASNYIFPYFGSISKLTGGKFASPQKRLKQDYDSYFHQTVCYTCCMIIKSCMYELTRTTSETLNDVKQERIQ